MKAGAIFDMDGLLFDTELVYNREWYKIANQYGLTIHEKMLDELRGTNGSVMNDIINRYCKDVDAEKLTKELFENAKHSLAVAVPMKAGAHELLDYLKVHAVKMAIASSAPNALIINNLKCAGIETYFDVVVSGQQVTHGKPAPDIFLLAASKLELAASDCYVLEDSIHGVHAGVHAGCFTIMVPDLITPDAHVWELCNAIYPSLFDVIEALRNEEL